MEKEIKVRMTLGQRWQLMPKKQKNIIKIAFSGIVLAAIAGTVYLMRKDNQGSEDQMQKALDEISEAIEDFDGPNYIVGAFVRNRTHSSVFLTTSDYSDSMPGLVDANIDTLEAVKLAGIEKFQLAYPEVAEEFDRAVAAVREGEV